MSKDFKRPTTISLIGMPGAGKSTVGVLLAKLAGLAFRDTDLDIQVHAQATLHDILQRDGYRQLRQLEQQVLMQIPLDHCVISTGGSVVYSKAAMGRLADAGPIVYLKTKFEILAQRVAATPHRGIASGPGETFADIYAERIPLYERFSDVSIDTAAASAQQVAARVLHELGLG